MITELVQIIKSWPMFMQFLFMTFLFYFIFHIVNKIVFGIDNFLSEALPIILHGWPEDLLTDLKDDDLDKTEDKK